jgi:hypothetical protein
MIGEPVTARFARCIGCWPRIIRSANAVASACIRAMPSRNCSRCSSMRSKPVADLLIDLQIAKTHSRPHVSDDNPYSESQFKTLKYRPDFPQRFGCIEDARAYCQQFFEWYNTEHRHAHRRVRCESEPFTPTPSCRTSARRDRGSPKRNRACGTSPPAACIGLDHRGWRHEW